MPRFPKARKRPDTTPAYLATAKSFYGEAFGPRRKADLAESMADWAELSDEEQSFALAHLQYLNLIAQAGTQRLLLQVRQVLVEIEDGIGEALEEVAVAPSDDEDLDAGDDDELAGFDDPVEFPEIPEQPELTVPEPVEDSDEADQADQTDDEPESESEPEGGGE